MNHGSLAEHYCNELVAAVNAAVRYAAMSQSLIVTLDFDDWHLVYAVVNHKSYLQFVVPASIVAPEYAELAFDSPMLPND